MAYITRENMSAYAVRYAQNIRYVSKEHLTNHGKKFSGPLEKRAILRYKEYLGSCGRFLTNYRVSSRKGNEYYG